MPIILLVSYKSLSSNSKNNQLLTTQRGLSGLWLSSKYLLMTVFSTRPVYCWKVHSQQLLWEQIDCHMWDLLGFFTQCTIFHKSRARCLWQQGQAFIYGLLQKQNFLGNPLKYNMNIDGFSLLGGISPIRIPFLAEHWWVERKTG